MHRGPGGAVHLPAATASVEDLARTRGVVAQDPAGPGTAAAERLFRRIDGDVGPYRRIVRPTRLIARGSGGIPPPGTERRSNRERRG